MHTASSIKTGLIFLKLLSYSKLLPYSMFSP
ncbi:hypothetical protein NEOC65_000287 [Neochlamydia sp. AcF65]|nr:hypothetical protein [Neochlamydia sp. AcF65]